MGDNVLLGPDGLGAFLPTSIKSIQRKRVNVLHAEAGQSVSFALKRIKRAGVRKGQVILPKTDVHPVAVRRFEGQVRIMSILFPCSIVVTDPFSLFRSLYYTTRRLFPSPIKVSSAFLRGGAVLVSAGIGIKTVVNPG